MCSDPLDPQAITRVFLDDPETMRETLLFYRLHAVLMTRAVDPQAWHLVGGATSDADHVLGGPTAAGWGAGLIGPTTSLPPPAPALPLPIPSPVICGLPEHLVQVSARGTPSASSGLSKSVLQTYSDQVRPSTPFLPFLFMPAGRCGLLRLARQQPLREGV
jgi:hypothetical protein